MNRQWIARFGCLVLCLYFTGGANALDIKEDLLALYMRWDKAYLHHDVPTLTRLLDSNFRIVTGQGKVIGRKAYIASIKKSKSPKAYTTKLLRAERKGNRAYAWTEERSQQGSEPVNIHRYRDTWLRSANHWLMLESKTLDKH